MQRVTLLFVAPASRRRFSWSTRVAKSTGETPAPQLISRRSRS